MGEEKGLARSPVRRAISSLRAASDVDAMMSTDTEY